MSYRRILTAAVRIAVSALASVALIGSTIGCSTLRPVSGTPQVGQITKVSFARYTRIDVVKDQKADDTLHLAAVSMIEGRVVRVAGDTLQMTVARTSPRNSRAILQLALVPLSSAARVEHRKFSAVKTTFLILGMVLAIVASQGIDMKLDFSGGGGLGM